jgi:hypothetical protein
VRWELWALAAQLEVLAPLDPLVSVDLTVWRAPSDLWVILVPLATLGSQGLRVMPVPLAPVAPLASPVRMARRVLTHLKVELVIVVTAVRKEIVASLVHQARKVSRARRVKEAVMVVVVNKASWVTRVMRASLAVVVLMAVVTLVLKAPKASRGRRATKVLLGRVQVARPVPSV